MLSTTTLLDFEATHPGHPGNKGQAIEQELGITAARFYQLLSRAIDEPEAERIDPLLVHRLRRLRDRADTRYRAQQHG